MRYSRTKLFQRYTPTMNNRTITFIILIFAAVTWTIVKSMDASGGSIIWFLILLLLALLNYYLGFVDRSNTPFRFYAQAGFVIFLLLTVFMAYIARQESEGLELIGEYIDPYPNVESISFIPRTSARTVQHWQIKTTDSVQQIKAFYSEVDNVRDWQLVMSEPNIVLERDNHRLTISVAEYPRVNMNMIFYYIEKNSPDS